jgi:YHS domain-containing protein
MWIVCMLALGWSDDAPSSPSTGADSDAIIAALKPWSGIVGEWNGTGIPQDAKSKRERVFWRSDVKWQWSLEPGSTGLVCDAEGDGNAFRRLFLTYDVTATNFRLQSTDTKGAKIEYVGGQVDGLLELIRQSDTGNVEEQKITLRLVHEDRFVLEQWIRKDKNSRWMKSLQLGATRKGVAFATASSGPECIVTGGRGTMQVTHNGKTYFVCCTGCKQAFEKDPEKYISALKK